jgi:predicted CXXCH cytochrome family protein
MKLTTIFSAAALLAAVAMTSQGAVKDTKHNMNNVFGVGTVQDNQVCLPCHAPHNQPTGAAADVGTLWNHVMSANATFKLYDNTAIGGNIEGAPVVGLDETSKKCLSCHDGSVAVDSYGGYTFKTMAAGGSTFGPTTGTHTLGVTNDANGSTAGFVGGAGGDLSHDHPVGVKYPASGYIDPATWTRTGYTTAAGVVVAYVKADGTAGGTVAGGGFELEGGNVKGVGVVGCGSCHSPHGDTYNFLTISNYGSQLCMTCHTR